MRISGSSSWRLEMRDSQLLHVALFVRDREGILMPGDSRLPPAVRHVATASTPRPHGDARVLGPQWMRWWQRLAAHEVGSFAIARTAQARQVPVEDMVRQLADAGSAAFDPPDFGTLADSPELRAVVTRRWKEALDWFAGRSAEPRHTRPGIPAISHVVIERAALGVAAERGVPIDRLDAAVDLLDVTGLWSHSVAPGHMLCSVELIRDDDAAEDVVRRAFISGLDGQAS